MRGVCKLNSGLEGAPADLTPAKDADKEDKEHDYPSPPAVATFKTLFISIFDTGLGPLSLCGFR
jgi:hypothetical protein